MVDIDSINCILLVTEIKARKINVVKKKKMSVEEILLFYMKRRKKCF